MSIQCLTLKQLLYQAHKTKKIIDISTVIMLRGLGDGKNNIQILTSVLKTYGIEISKSIFSPGKFVVTWPIEVKTVKYKSIW